MIYEKRSSRLLPRALFLRRLAFHAFFALGVLAIALGVGVVGYRTTEGMPWLDALLNAAMILGGMGPVDVLQTDAGKWFASFYALFSGIVFLAVVGVMLAPIVHRLLHHFHMEE